MMTTQKAVEPEITSYFSEYSDEDYNLEAFSRIAYRTGKYDGRSARHIHIDKCDNCEDKDAQLCWFLEDDCYYSCHTCAAQVCKSCMVGIPEYFYHKHFNNTNLYPDYDKELWGAERLICGGCYADYLFRYERGMK